MLDLAGAGTVQVSVPVCCRLPPGPVCCDCAFPLPCQQSRDFLMRSVSAGGALLLYHKQELEAWAQSLTLHSEITKA